MNSMRSWWRNCALQTDEEIKYLDRLEDEIGPLDKKISRIRELISGLELCHHKSRRWVDNIIEAIGTGESRKGLGTNPSGHLHPRVIMWENICRSLTDWLAGGVEDSIESATGTLRASQIPILLGQPSPLKKWQVQRVINKIRSTIPNPVSPGTPVNTYVWILLGGSEYEAFYRRHCPEAFRKQRHCWISTVKTFIHDTVNKKEADLSLGLAIDMLWPCHWGFSENLKIVLAAIGGNLYPEQPFAACGRNICLLPIRSQMVQIAQTLSHFFHELKGNQPARTDLLEKLGTPTKMKRWLAGSLAKTIRLQLNPPEDVREITALSGPHWLKLPS